MRMLLSGSLFVRTSGVALVGLLACSDPNDSSDDPTILLMNPMGVPAGSSPFQIAVYGENFVEGSVLHWNGEERPSFSSGNSIVSAFIPASDVSSRGSARISVSLPNGRSSDARNFTIGEYIEPQMTVASVAPDHGSPTVGDLEITVSGSGFVRGTAVFMDFTALQTTVVSSTTLRATVPASLLTLGRPVELRMGVPNVWVSSTTRSWEIRAPVPTISSLAPAGAGAGSTNLMLRVQGSGFMANSTVLRNGNGRPTTFVSATELEATLFEEDLISAGTLAITVGTPAPWGGQSPAADFVITNEQPELTALPVLGVTAGGPELSLMVHGQHFATGTLVEWNGAARPTFVRSGRRLMATISAADIAAPGTVSITVRTPGFPATPAHTLTIHPTPSATVTDIKTLALPATWLTTDPVSGRLFATVPGSATAHGNTVAEINPVSGTILTSVLVGSDPSVAEVSDDGQYLYVGLDGAQSVRRVSLPGLVPGPQFPLGGFTVQELHVMPGQPQTVAVSRRNADLIPSNAGLVIYDDGVARGLTGPEHTGSNSFGWTADGKVIFGYNFETSEFGLRRVDVGPGGATEVWVDESLIGGYYMRISVVGDQIYGGDGSVVDGDLRERLGRRCGAPGWFTVDRELGRAFYWPGRATIQVCDMTTYQVLGEINVPGVTSADPAERHNLVRWGTDGLAFSDGVNTYLVRTPLAGR
jgi:hypothetical protein